MSLPRRTRDRSQAGESITPVARVTRGLFPVALACALAFGILAWWQARRARELAQAAAIAIHPAKGQVLQVDRASGSVTIAHQDIPGFMPAMTMTFRVKSPYLLDNIKAGDEVEFELEVTAKSVTIRSIKNSRSPTSE